MLLSDFGSMTYSGTGNGTAVTANLPVAPAGYSGTKGYGYDGKDQLTEEQSTRGGCSNNRAADDGHARWGILVPFPAKNDGL